jgi:hypothetical protein
LRVRRPVVAASAEAPTVRSCVAALLVLGALVLGRDALSLQMLAVAGDFVLLGPGLPHFWHSLGGASTAGPLMASQGGPLVAASSLQASAGCAWPGGRLAPGG